MKYEDAIASAKPRYESLGISQEMERVVLEHLEALGALTNCFTAGSTECTGGCPEGQHCVKTTTNNCVCSV